eukprot:90866-Pyramimonas_sp.AAC.1
MSEDGDQEGRRSIRMMRLPHLPLKVGKQSREAIDYADLPAAGQLFCAELSALIGKVVDNPWLTAAPKQDV